MQDSQGNYHAFLPAILLSLVAFREATAGDEGNASVNGGLLASDTTPALSGTGSTVSQEISWAAGNTDQILIDTSLPEDFDGRDDALVEMWVSSGSADLASMTVVTSWDGGANVTDTAVDPLASATVHKITARIDKADITPKKPSFLSIALTPAAHATNPIVLKAIRVRYVNRPVEA